MKAEKFELNTNAYKIEAGIVRLAEIIEHINCPLCDRLLAQVGSDEVILIRSRVILVDHGQVVVRCGECHNFTVLKNGKDRKLAI